MEELSVRDLYARQLEIWKDVQNESCREFNSWNVSFSSSFHISNRNVVLAKISYFQAISAKFSSTFLLKKQQKIASFAFLLEIWKSVQNKSCREINSWQLSFWTSFHISNGKVFLANFSYFLWVSTDFCWFCCRFAKKNANIRQKQLFY